MTERDSSLLTKLSEDEGLRDASFTLEPDIRVTLPVTLVTNSFSAEKAGVLAQELANKRAQSLYKCEPFVRGSPASQVGGQWVWRARHGWGTVDFEAEVRFGLEGAEPHVNVVLLDNRL